MSETRTQKAFDEDGNVVEIKVRTIDRKKSKHRTTPAPGIVPAPAKQTEED